MFRSLIITALCAFVLLPVFTVRSADFLSDFAHPLLQPGGPGDEAAYDFAGVKDTNKFIDNIKALFYPDDINGGKIWDALRVLGVAVFFALLVRTGIKFVLNADDAEEVKKNQLMLLYILLGVAIFFLARRILSKLLNIWGIEGAFGDGNFFTVVSQATNKVAVLVLGFLKGIAFFVALIFLLQYGFQMVTAVGEEEKTKAARQGILNVVLALIFIKIIDYLYYIALGPNFTGNAITFIVQASKFIAYLIGASIILSLLYAGYLMVTGAGSEENYTKAKNIVKSVFIVALLVLLFMLIIYQIFNDIVG